MKYISKELIDWAVDKIKKEYVQDIALLIGHEHWKIAPDGTEVSFNFFVPSTDKGYNLAQTFIIDEIGYDLFPMSWDRLEGIANLNETLTTCVADGIILYARSEEDKERFLNLQKKQKENFNNKEFTYRKGLEKINIAMDIYKNMLFEKSLSRIRKASGYIAQYLSEAVAAVNGTYFKRGPENQIAVLTNMAEVPEGFTGLYSNIILAKTVAELRDICYEMLAVTRDFFSNRKEPKEAKESEYNFQALANWYEEGKYWFRRIYYYCDINDAVNCFAWGHSFQQEFDYVTEEFGLKSMEFMKVFDAADLSTFRKCAEEFENYIVSEITKHGVEIRQYNNLDEFLEENR